VEGLYMQLPSREIVKVIIKHHHSTLAVDNVDHINVSFIGQGYANFNVRVTVNQTKH
jgi:hypothetical protein